VHLIFSCSGKSIELDRVRAVQRPRRLWKVLVPGWSSLKTGWMLGACWLQPLSLHLYHNFFLQHRPDPREIPKESFSISGIMQESPSSCAGAD